MYKDKVYRENTCNHNMKCYTHLICSLHRHTDREDLYKYTPADLVSAQCVCVSVCVFTYMYTEWAKHKVKCYSEVLQDFSIKSSRKTERLIEACCKLSTDSSTRGIIAVSGHVVTTCLTWCEWWSSSHEWKSLATTILACVHLWPLTETRHISTLILWPDTRDWEQRPDLRRDQTSCFPTKVYQIQSNTNCHAHKMPKQWHKCTLTR